MKQVLVKIENITKQFGDNIVLNGLSLEVREGEVVVIVGQCPIHRFYQAESGHGLSEL